MIGGKEEKYGDLNFISFLGVVLSRLAYFDDSRFFDLYERIMGPIIKVELLEGIDSVKPNNLRQLLDDELIYGLNNLNNSNSIFKENIYTYANKNYVDFLKLNMPQMVNDVTGEKDFKQPIPSKEPLDSKVKYISIAWSNYGEIYIVADKRMPTTLFVLFRGTYSAKTAGLYTKPTSIKPLNGCNDGRPESFLYGMYKPTIELIHTIIETMTYLVTDFLGVGEDKRDTVKIFTTGHSLGGGMCTIFSYLWMEITEVMPYKDTYPYNLLSKNIICVSAAAPRVFSKTAARIFCNYVEARRILYLRIVSRGDIVPSVPKIGYEHPCSTNEEMRKLVSQDCKSTNSNLVPLKIDYNKNFDCKNTKRTYFGIGNLVPHGFYLGIKFVRALNIGNFVSGMAVSREILREKNGGTVCRLIQGPDKWGVIFFSLNEARLKPNNTDALLEETAKLETGNNNDPNNIVGGGIFEDLLTLFSPATSNSTTFQKTEVKQINTPDMKMSGIKMSGIKIGGPVAQDVRVTREAFKKLIDKMDPLVGNFNPQKGKMAENVFNNKLMPEIGCNIKEAETASREEIKKSQAGGTKLKNKKYTRKIRKNKKKYNKNITRKSK
jgi:hypothetical protein